MMFTNNSMYVIIVNRNRDIVRKAESRDKICYCFSLWPVTSLRKCTMAHSWHKTVWGLPVYSKTFSFYAVAVYGYARR